MKAFQFSLQALLVCIISAKLCNLVLASSSDSNDRPIIGLLTVPTTQQCPNEPAATGSILGPLNAEYRCYIPAGYAKLIEMTAARVVLLPCNINAKFINAVQSVNGFLLTGMFTDYQCEDTTIPYSLTPYGEAGKYIIDYVFTQNQAGIHLPLFSVCKGYNMMTFLKAGVPFWRDLIRSDIQSLDQPAPIEWNPAIDPKDSLIYRTALLLNASALLTNGPNLMNRHPYGILPGNYTANSNLTDVFGPFISTTVDLRGVRYVSSVQSRFGYPIIGVATHPEKVLFEWNPTLVYPRTKDAIHVNLLWSLLLSQAARKNNRSFASSGNKPLESELLWYNTTTHRVTDAGDLMGGEFRQLVFTWPLSTTATNSTTRWSSITIVYWIVAGIGWGLAIIFAAALWRKSDIGIESSHSADSALISSYRDVEDRGRSVNASET